MKQYLYFLALVLLASCSSNNSDLLLENENQLLQMFEKAKSENLNEVESYVDSGLGEMMKNYNVDKILIGHNKYLEGLFPTTDLVFFVQNSQSIFEPQTIMAYDYGLAPREIDDKDIPGASFKSVRVKERWYILSLGFD